MQQQNTCGACGWSKTSSVREASKCYALHARYCKELKRLNAEGVVFVDTYFQDDDSITNGLKMNKKGYFRKATKLCNINGVQIYEGGTFQTDDAETMFDIENQIRERKLRNAILNIRKELGIS